MEQLQKIKQWFSPGDTHGDGEGLYPPVIPRGKREDLEAQIRGTIYGNCMGDAIGLLTEFMTKKQADMVYYKMYYEDKKLEYEHKIDDGHRGRWKTGDWTDDSDQMILIMDSILDCNGEVKATDFAAKLLNWAHHGYKELGDYGGMGIGATTSHVLRHDLYKTDPHAAAEDIWTKSGCVVAPNGGVMRTSILGIYEYEDMEKVVSNSKVMSKVTHADPRCTASCIAVTSAIAFMLRKDPKHLQSDGGYDVEAIVKDSYRLAKTAFVDVKKGKAYSKELKFHMFATNLKDLQLEDKNKIGYTFKAMGSGFWALRQDDFRTALQSITMEAGDADTNGAVAGAMLGCKLYDKLPDTWLSGLKHKTWLDERIDRFLSFMFGPKVGEDVPAPAKDNSNEAASSEPDTNPSQELQSQTVGGTETRDDSEEQASTEQTVDNMDTS